MSRENDSTRGEGAELASALDQLFRSGNFGSVMDSLSAQPLSPTEDGTLKQQLNGHIEDFCDGISIENARTMDRRNAASGIRMYFETWKNTKMIILEGKSSPRSEVEAMQGLTLKDVANYASEQFNKFRREASTLIPGTSEQLQAREKSDYWSILDKIIGPAADPDL